MNSSIVKIRQTVPLFAVADMEKLVAFYVDGLGFEMREEWVKDDELQWCWFQRGDIAIMVEKFQTNPPANIGAGLMLVFICEDAKAAHREFKERGIQVGDPFVGNNMDVF